MTMKQFLLGGRSERAGAWLDFLAMQPLNELVARARNNVSATRL
jgi:hypothetical protein